MEILPDDSTKDDFEMAFRLVVSAWNAVVIDTWNNTDEMEQAFFDALQPIKAESNGIPQILVQRNKDNYSPDLRAVGEYSVIEKNGELVFRAEAKGSPKNLEVNGKMLH